MDPIFFEFWVMKTKLYNSFFINPNTLSFSQRTDLASQQTDKIGLNESYSI